MSEESNLNMELKSIRRLKNCECYDQLFHNLTIFDSGRRMRGLDVMFANSTPEDC